MVTDTVRIALVGCGTIALGMHLPGIQAIAAMGKAELVAVCDAVEEKARAAQERFGVPAYYTDLQTMLCQADFDVLVNTTPIPAHYPVTMAALQAGKHVYTQKPLATSVEECTRLLEEARRRGLMLACAPEHPVRPVIQTMARLVREGAIGRVAFARVQSSHDGPEKHDVPRDSTWYYKPGSSPILDLGVHGLSQITSILGPVRRLACFSGRTLPVRFITAGPFAGKRIDVEIDDNSLLMLDFGDATFAFLDATYCVEASRGPRLELYGSEGTLSLEGRTSRGAALYLYESARKAWREVEVPPAPPVRDLGVWHMVECLREGTPLRLTAEHGRHLVDIMTSAPQAAAEGRAVELQTTF